MCGAFSFARGRSRSRAAPPVRIAPDLAFLGDDGFPRPPRRHRRLRWLLWASVTLVALACAGATAALALYVALARSLPSTEDLASTHLEQSTKIYDRRGGLLFEIFEPAGGRRTLVAPERIPNVLKQATIATEDPSFYSNPGVDLRGIVRAIYYDLSRQAVVTGGSTITQQLIKNTLLTPEPTLQRKLREAVLSFEVTRRYSKDQVLSMYLNTVYYGNLSYGIEAAARSYFGKDVTELTAGEASLLAGLPQAPSAYDPCTNPDSALGRQGSVLEAMEREGFLSAEESLAARSETSQEVRSEAFARRCRNSLALQSPHFVEYVRSELEARYGPEVVYKGGLTVYTTLDPTLQNIVEDEARRQIAALKGHDVSSAAVAAVDPRTGEILAMLGSVDFFDKNIDGQVNVATSLRQPGSSIKPINYVTALEKGWTPATPILDASTAFPNGSGPPYVPVNYDGREHGLVNVRLALANSLNIAAVKTLYFVGVPNMIATARNLGITSFQDPARYGLSLTLGGGEVELLELTGAYAVFANAGRRMPLTPFTRIVDGQGNLLYDLHDSQPEAVLDPRHAYLITDILSDNYARAQEFGLDSPLRTSRPAFAKTGTTNDFKDNWTLGGTPELAVGVWVGNPRNQPMRNVSGIAGAAPIWHNVLERAYQAVDNLKSIKPHPFPVPPGLVQMTVCNESGLVPTDLCPPSHRHSEIFLSNQAPTQPDNVWYKLQIDRANGLLATRACPADRIEERVFVRMPQDLVMPYQQVLNWGALHGLPQPPQFQSPCVPDTLSASP